MKSQVLIASYHKDFEWLIHCLGSLKRFASGFLHPVICVDESDVVGCQHVIDRAYQECTIAVKNGKGPIRAQLSMMEGDIHCPDADFVFLVGSDCFAAGPISPDPYFKNGVPIMLMTKYTDLDRPGHDNALPWRNCVRSILGIEPEYEFMRRLPLVYPKALFHKFRQHVEALIHKPFEEFIRTYQSRHGDCSESNLMGSFAWKFMQESYEWIDTQIAGVVDGDVTGCPSSLRQFWSWGGLDRPTEASFVFDGLQSAGRTPRQILDHVLYNIPCK